MRGRRLAHPDRRRRPPHRRQGGAGQPRPRAARRTWPVLREAIDDVLRRGESATGHVFNLGHGVPPDTDPDVLTRIVDYVHSA
ncbi:MAG: uroporphyrinogen decarboxylase family protein [Micropruina glycogenica]